MLGGKVQVSWASSPRWRGLPGHLIGLSDTALISVERGARIDPALLSGTIKCGIHVHWLPDPDIVVEGVERTLVSSCDGRHPLHLALAHDQSRGVLCAAHDQCKSAPRTAQDGGRSFEHTSQPQRTPFSSRGGREGLRTPLQGCPRSCAIRAKVPPVLRKTGRVPSSKECTHIAAPLEGGRKDSAPGPQGGRWWGGVSDLLFFSFFLQNRMASCFYTF